MARKFTFISAATLLALSAAAALAQNAANPSAGGNQTRCWDAASSQVRTVTEGTVGARGGSSIPPSAGIPSGRLGHLPISPTAPGGVATRPPEAASLPNC